MCTDNHHQLMSSLTFRIHQLVILTDKFADAHLQSLFGLSLSQFFILCILQCSPDSNQKLIAEHLGISPAAVSKQIEKLESLGILGKSNTQADRRQHNWQMTKLGVQKFEKAFKEMQNLTAKAESTLTEEEQKIMNQGLNKLFQQI